MIDVEFGTVLHMSKMNIQSTSAELQKTRMSILQSFRPISLNDA